MRAGDERREVAPGQRGRELKSDLVAQSAQPARSRAADADPVRRPCLKQLPRQVPDRSLLLEVDRKAIPRPAGIAVPAAEGQRQIFPAEPLQVGISAFDRQRQQA